MRKVRALFCFTALLGSLTATGQQQDSAVNSLVVPVAGEVTGAEQVRFHSELTVVNFLTTPQLIELEWLPSTGDQAGPRTARLTIEGYSFVTLEEVVSETLHATGVGAIRVRAIRDDGRTDPNGSLDGSSRIISSGEAGTFSQFVPAQRAGHLLGQTPGYIHGVRQDREHRTNVGIVNLGPEIQSWRVIIRGTTGKVELPIQVEAGRAIQLPVPGRVSGTISVFLEPLAAPSGTWTAYASTVNRENGGAWTIPAVAGPPNPFETEKAGR